MRRNGTTIKCKCCGTPFYIPANRKKTAKYCSLFCHNHKKWDMSLEIPKYLKPLSDNSVRVTAPLPDYPRSNINTLYLKTKGKI